MGVEEFTEDSVVGFRKGVSVTVVADWVMRGLMTVACLFVGFIGTKVIDLDKRVTSIEANRFTSGDMLKYVQDADVKNSARFELIRKEISGLRTGIAKLPTEVPPDWLLERMAREEMLTASRLNKLENDVDRLKENAHNAGKSSR